MTRKHVIALAAAIKQIDDAYTRGITAKAVADACASQNPRFNRAAFYAACKVIGV